MYADDDDELEDSACAREDKLVVSTELLAIP